MNTKTTLVIGASTNTERYSYVAIHKLHAHHHPVIAIGNKAGIVDGTEIQTGMPNIKDIHTITLYINPLLQKKYLNYILNLKPERIIFNPGTENEELYNLVIKNNIVAVEACTLVLLSTNQY